MPAKSGMRRITASLRRLAFSRERLTVPTPGWTEEGKSCPIVAGACAKDRQGSIGKFGHSWPGVVETCESPNVRGQLWGCRLACPLGQPFLSQSLAQSNLFGLLRSVIG